MCSSVLLGPIPRDLIAGAPELLLDLLGPRSARLGPERALREHRGDRGDRADEGDAGHRLP